MIQNITLLIVRNQCIPTSYMVQMNKLGNAGPAVNDKGSQRASRGEDRVDGCARGEGAPHGTGVTLA